jgi:hypothetical protein
LDALAGTQLVRTHQGDAYGTERDAQKFEIWKSELKARPSHPPLAGRLSIGSLRSIVARHFEHGVSR